MPRVVHFEISADDPERASKFYADVFGWTFQKWDGPMPYWLVMTGDEGPGINGGMFVRQGPMNGHVNCVDVPSIDDYLARAVAAGATVAMPKTPMPGVGYLAYFKDTEGSLIGLWQMDPDAKA
jgi:predicted enzyme related to lactoylglutathione lyase